MKFNLLYIPRRHRGGVNIYIYIFFDLGTKRDWVLKATLGPLSVTYSTGCWVGFKVCINGRGKSPSLGFWTPKFQNRGPLLLHELTKLLCVNLTTCFGIQILKVIPLYQYRFGFCRPMRRVCITRYCDQCSYFALSFEIECSSKFHLKCQCLSQIKHTAVRKKMG